MEFSKGEKNYLHVYYEIVAAFYTNHVLSDELTENLEMDRGIHLSEYAKELTDDFIAHNCIESFDDEFQKKIDAFLTYRLFPILN